MSECVRATVDGDLTDEAPTLGCTQTKLCDRVIASVKHPSLLMVMGGRSQETLLGVLGSP